jgi:hypothetical protein
VQGIQGPQGTQGTPGTPGAAGSSGPSGGAGVAGSVGATGASGPQGSPGSTGAPGAPGVGTTGSQGVAGTPGSTDKAAIEAAISGCYVLSENPDTQELLGMSDFWKRNKLDSPTLINQLEFIANRSRKLIPKDRNRISSLAAENNNLSNVIEKVVIALKI